MDNLKRGNQLFLSDNNGLAHFDDQLSSCLDILRNLSRYSGASRIVYVHLAESDENIIRILKGLPSS